MTREQLQVDNFDPTKTHSLEQWATYFYNFAHQAPKRQKLSTSTLLPTKMPQNKHSRAIRLTPVKTINPAGIASVVYTSHNVASKRSVANDKHGCGSTEEKESQPKEPQDVSAITTPTIVCTDTSGVLGQATANVPPLLGDAADATATQYVDVTETATTVQGTTSKSASDARILVFDTETANLNGIVIQLAYAVYEPSGICLQQYNELLRLPRGESWNYHAAKVHKIKITDVASKGRDPITELTRFAKICNTITKEGGVIVAHNASFDCRAVRYTWKRNGGAVGGDNALPNALLSTCTMQMAKGHMPVRNKRGHFKAPTNTELYTYLFRTEPKNDAYLANIGTGRTHDAAFDIAMTARCYFEGRRRRWW